MSRLLFAKGSDTSEDAAVSVQKDGGRLRNQVLCCVTECGHVGATCDEVEEKLSMRHQTASARIYELRERGLLCDSGVRRLTRSGRRAVVWWNPTL